MALNNRGDCGSNLETDYVWKMGTWDEFQSQLEKSLPLEKQNSSNIAFPVRSKLEMDMLEFRMNGKDSPYDPECQLDAGSLPFSPSEAFMRQKSWPAPDASPIVPLSASTAHGPPQLVPANVKTTAATGKTPSPTPHKPAEVTDLDEQVRLTHEAWNSLTDEQKSVLTTLPDKILYLLLRLLERSRDLTAIEKNNQITECGFCKNNGERVTFYRSHSLRERGRVTCPVLRAYVCHRCGAHGDRAHTLKYCPLATADERSKSTALLHSKRSASGRRRSFHEYGHEGPDNTHYLHNAPLQPVWEDLWRKLNAE